MTVNSFREHTKLIKQMKQFKAQIACGIGDLLVTRIFFDSVKNQYNQIRIAYNRKVVETYRDGNPQYYRFLDGLGGLLFSEPPYFFDHAKHPEVNMTYVLMNMGAPIRTPRLDHLLCRGTSLNLGEPYIVITTKIRCINKKTFYPLSIKLWKTLRELSKKYKIVIMGERAIEIGKEYRFHLDIIHCIYDQIIANIPQDRIVDLTVPALGITVPDLTKLQQDCLIQRDAEFTLTLGIGGNLWIALAAAKKIIGFRADDDRVTDLINNPEFGNAFITKNWGQFIAKLEEYK